MATVTVTAAAYEAKRLRREGRTGGARSAQEPRRATIESDDEAQGDWRPVRSQARRVAPLAPAPESPGDSCGCLLVEEHLECLYRGAGRAS